jgi:hypothetical protein
MFFVKVIGGVAYLRYDEPENSVLDLRETYVPLSSRNKGITSELVKYGMEYAKIRDLKIIPSCPFVQSYISKNPRYRKLTASKIKIGKIY